MGELQQQNTQQHSTDFEVKDLGRPNSLRFNVLTDVINEDYDRAVKVLTDFLESESKYPNFRLKIERYCVHSIDLIYAIKSKKSFSGLGTLTRSKQQELRYRFKEHFRDLRANLKKMEKAMEELRLNDVKSTKIVVISVWSSVVVVFCVAVAIDFFQGLGQTIANVMSEEVESLLLFIIKKIF